MATKGRAEIEIDVDGKKAKKELSAVEKSMEGFGSTVKKVGGALIAAFAVNRIASFASESVRLARVQIDAEKRVAAAIKSTGGAAGVTTEELKAMASGLQDVTNYGDEATLVGQSMLLTFTKIGRDVFPQATETMLNMSTAMNVDLKTSAIQLGKALNEPIEGVAALRRVGVQLTDQQEQQIKEFVEVGRIADAQRVILGELEVQFGGLARATVDPLTQISNTFGDLREELGMALLPALKDIAAEAQEFIKEAKKSGDLERTFKGVAAAAMGIADALALAVDAYNALTMQGTSQANKDLSQSNAYMGQFALFAGDAADKVGKINEQAKKASESVKAIEPPKASAPEPPKGPKPLSDEAVKEAAEVAKVMQSIRERQAMKEAEIANRSAALEKQILKDQLDDQFAYMREELEAQQLYDGLIIGSMEEGVNKRLTLIDYETELEKDRLRQRDEYQVLSSQQKLDALIAIEQDGTNKRLEIQKKYDEDVLSSASRANFQMVSNYADAAQMIAGTMKGTGIILKGIAMAEIAINTSRGVMQAITSPPGPPATIPLAASMGVLGAAQLAKVASQGFADGGIVGGSSYYGDRVPARVNSGEMILNKGQQAQLFQMANGGGGGGDRIEININAGAGSDPRAIANAVSDVLRQHKKNDREAKRRGVKA